MNYKINDSHTDPFYIGFFSVVDFPVSQQFQFDPCSIRKRKPVVIDGFYRIKFDLFHGFFHRINGDGNVVISIAVDSVEETMESTAMEMWSYPFSASVLMLETSQSWIPSRNQHLRSGFSPISRHICMSKTSSKNFCASS